jgi:hypothetical protein
MNAMKKDTLPGIVQSEQHDIRQIPQEVDNLGDVDKHLGGDKTISDHKDNDNLNKDPLDKGNLDKDSSDNQEEIRDFDKIKGMDKDKEDINHTHNSIEEDSEEEPTYKDKETESKIEMKDNPHTKEDQEEDFKDEELQHLQRDPQMKPNA